MRILLDECLPRKLKRELAGHLVKTVHEMGWSGMKNGQLLRSAEPHFELFLTSDQNLEYQQNLRSNSLAIIVLVAHDNRFVTLRPLMPAVLAQLDAVAPGIVVRISGKPLKE